MGKKDRTNGKISAILIGGVGASILCLIGLAGLTQMVILERTGERGVAIVVPLLLLVSSLIGCQITSTVTGKNRMIAIAMTMVFLLFVMIIAGLTMDGAFENILINIGSVLGGGVTSCVLCLKKPAKGTRRKRHYR